MSEKDGSGRVDGAFMLKPLLSYPEQFLLTLHVEGHSGIVTCVYQPGMVQYQLGW